MSEEAKITLSLPMRSIATIDDIIQHRKYSLEESFIVHDITTALQFTKKIMERYDIDISKSQFHISETNYGEEVMNPHLMSTFQEKFEATLENNSIAFLTEAIKKRGDAFEISPDWAAFYAELYTILYNAVNQEYEKKKEEDAQRAQEDIQENTQEADNPKTEETLDHSEPTPKEEVQYEIKNDEEELPDNNDYEYEENANYTDTKLGVECVEPTEESEPVMEDENRKNEPTKEDLDHVQKNAYEEWRDRICHGKPECIESEKNDTDELDE